MTAELCAFVERTGAICDRPRSALTHTPGTFFHPFTPSLLADPAVAQTVRLAVARWHDRHPMITLAAMDIDPIRARALAVRRHAHPVARLRDLSHPECTACQFRKASQMLNDRDVRLALLLSDATSDRYRLLRRVVELERALGTTIVKLGALVGTLEEIA